MNTKDQVDALRDQLLAEGVPKPDAVRQIALATLGWPYVFGAWGEWCMPRNRGNRMRSDHPTIKSKCRVLSGSYDWKNIRDNRYCSGCQWGNGVRMYDCRGLTDWLLKQVGIDLAGEGATSQYNTDANWARKGTIDDMPQDIVCCVFRRKKGSTKTMEHTGMYLGGNLYVDCSVNVKTGTKNWTHYAIPAELYSEEEIPVSTKRPILRKGSEGENVRELQERLIALGYDCGTKGADGKFGAKTEEAVKEFQRKHGLKVDGIVGENTWAELDKADAPKEQTYKIRMYGLTFDQVEQIRQVCPTAQCEVEKET